MLDPELRNQVENFESHKVGGNRFLFMGIRLCSSMVSVAETNTMKERNFGRKSSFG